MGSTIGRPTLKICFSTRNRNKARYYCERNPNKIFFLNITCVKLYSTVNSIGWVEELVTNYNYQIFTIKLNPTYIFTSFLN